MIFVATSSAAIPQPHAAVAEMDGQAVGFALWFSTFSTFRGQPGLYVEDLYVRPDYRGRGIGTALLAAVAAQAIERGCGRVEWSVLKWNTAAVGFYRSLGALVLDELTTCRVENESLRNLAGMASEDARRFLGGARSMNKDRSSVSTFVLPHIAQMAGYVPGEQPQGGGFIKLNTNENPYPPSPRVKSALLDAINDRLRLYPDPLSTAFCKTVAELHSVSSEMVMAGNGSDDLLTILTRAFVGPGDLAAYASPSYLLYSTLIALQNGRSLVVPYESDWSLDPGKCRRGRAQAFLACKPR